MLRRDHCRSMHARTISIWTHILVAFAWSLSSLPSRLSSITSMDFTMRRTRSRRSLRPAFLSPGVAVVWAAFFNFIAFAGVRNRRRENDRRRYGQYRRYPAGDQLFVLLAGVIGAIIWNLITWYLGLPTSSSHALVGAYAGAAITRISVISVLPVCKPC